MAVEGIPSFHGRAMKIRVFQLLIILLLTYNLADPNTTSTIFGSSDQRQAPKALPIGIDNFGSPDQRQAPKALPIGIDNFKEIMTNCDLYAYVDKTNLVLKLIQGSSKFVYLSRPNQFGKSLLTSTIEEIFRSNKKDLFKNTAIYNSSYKWAEHPIIRINLSRINRIFRREFLDGVDKELKHVGQSYGIPDQRTPNITDHFLKLANALHEKFGKPVVVLIEEYDSSPLEKFGLPDAALEILNYTRNFYNGIKSLGEKIRFCYITSVPEFSKAANFSGFDEIGVVDVSSEPDYSEITGFTLDEIDKNFGRHIEKIAKDEQVPIENIYNEMKTWYEGNKFSSSEVQVYNPYTIMTYLQFKNAHDVFGYRWGGNRSM